MKVVALGVLMVVVTGCGCEVVDTGNRGVRTNFGKVEGEPLPEGFYTYNPFSSDIIEMSVREEKGDGKTLCFTRDTQSVKVSYAVTYYPDPLKIGELYKQFGGSWDEKIVTPIVLQSIKDIVGQYVADDLVSKREEARNAAFKEVETSLRARNVIATTLSLTNLDFDDKYEQAVEAKVVAVQKAAEAKNKTVEVEENAKQRLITAEAEAKSMQIRSQALSANKSLVEYGAVQKWDGKLPNYLLGSAVPFIDLSKQ